MYFVPTPANTTANTTRKDCSGTQAAIRLPCHPPRMAPQTAPSASCLSKFPFCQCVLKLTNDGRTMPSSAAPCASACGKPKPKVRDGTKTVPPPTPSNPESNPVAEPSTASKGKDAKSPAPGIPTPPFKTPQALPPMSALTTNSQAPKPRFNTFGFMRAVRLAPIRAVNNADIARAADARNEASPFATYAWQATTLTENTTAALVPIATLGSMPSNDVKAGTTKKPPPRPSAPPKQPATKPMQAASRICEVPLDELRVSALLVFAIAPLAG
mmetsp:Transcript_13919/g.25671  ORF Transcript_13919/g.25671 Transcript_13919/m.25671 type:complete len:271 (+) Transcript_13919:80-892(+)